MKDILLRNKIDNQKIVYRDGKYVREDDIGIPAGEEIKHGEIKHLDYTGEEPKLRPGFYRVIGKKYAVIPGKGKKLEETVFLSRIGGEKCKRGGVYSN